MLIGTLYHLVIALDEFEVLRFLKSLPFEMVDVLKSIVQHLKIFGSSLGSEDDFVGYSGASGSVESMRARSMAVT